MGAGTKAERIQDGGETFAIAHGKEEENETNIEGEKATTVVTDTEMEHETESGNGTETEQGTEMGRGTETEQATETGRGTEMGPEPEMEQDTEMEAAIGMALAQAQTGSDHLSETLVIPGTPDPKTMPEKRTRARHAPQPLPLLPEPEPVKK